MRTTKSGYILPPPGAIEAAIDGQKMTFPSEAALIAYQSGQRSRQSESAPRVRRQRRRGAALRFYFKAIKAGGNHWNSIAASHAKAPKLTERIATEMGFSDIHGKLAEAAGRFVMPND